MYNHRHQSDPNSQESVFHHSLEALLEIFFVPIPKQTKDNMTGFSSVQQNHPFLLDSVFWQKSPFTINNDMFGLLLHESNNANSTLDNLAQITNNHNAFILRVTDKNSMDSSSVVNDKFDSSEQNSQKLITPVGKKRKCEEGSSNSAQSKISTDKRELKEKKQKKTKQVEEKEKSKEEKKSAEEAPTGYIHVRARRGQATDSHSLAERVRRERISERLKLLQALVPGCDKVTGKAHMLDEIINYVQSLQNQVEFLSMKLASVNTMFYDSGMDLESFMVRPEQDISNLPSQLPSMQGCPTTPNNYHFLENSANSILFQQAQIANLLPQLQGSRQTLWEVDDYEQKIINQSGFNNSLFSFH